MNGDQEDGGEYIVKGDSSFRTRSSDGRCDLPEYGMCDKDGKQDRDIVAKPRILLITIVL